MLHRKNPRPTAAYLPIGAYLQAEDWSVVHFFCPDDEGYVSSLKFSKTIVRVSGWFFSLYWQTREMTWRCFLALSRSRYPGPGGFSLNSFSPLRRSLSLFAKKNFKKNLWDQGTLAHFSENI